jgi:hypothetical protein
MPPTLRPRKGRLAITDLSSRNNPQKPSSAQPSRITASTSAMNSVQSSIIHQPGIAMTSNSPKEDTLADNDLGLLSNLLQTGQAASSSTVQVPTDVSATLLTSLEDLKNLKKEVKSLQHNFATQATRLAALALEIFGTKFTLFPKLPFELRQMIWRSALEVPRIVAIGRKPSGKEDDIIFSPVRPYSPLLWACRESRHEAQKVTPFLDVRCKIRTNTSIDTVWMLDGDGRLSEWDASLRPIQEAAEHMANSFITSIPTLALPCQFWVDFYQWPEVEFLCRLHTQEVILVIGDEQLARRPDVVFINPRDTPNHLLSEGFIERYITCYGNWDYKDMTWEIVEDSHINEFRRWVQDALERRLEFMNGKP